MLDTWSDTEIPILMDNVDCGSGSTNFLSCSSRAADEFDSHMENIFLTCFESGKGVKSFWRFFCQDFLMRFTKTVS